MSTLNDMTNCPVKDECDTCGYDQNLTLAIGQTPCGVFCCTVCIRCAGLGRLPTLEVSTATRWALDHCEHLGIDTDAMMRQMFTEALDQYVDPRRRRGGTTPA